jgi:PAS domain S-box-containing protein
MVQCNEVPEKAATRVPARNEAEAFREPPDRAPLGSGIGKPLDWSAVDRCRLLILITLPFFAAYALRSGYLLAHPDVEPYFDRGTLLPMRDGMVAVCIFWACFLVWGSLERRKPGPHTLYLVVGSLSWWLGVVGVAYALGPITTPAWIAVIIGCVTNVLLLPRGVAVFAISTGMALLLASLVGTMAGLIPYAPALADTPIVASQMALPYAIGNTISSVFATLAIVVIMGSVVKRWREALDRLRRMNVDLDRVVDDRTRELTRRAQAESALRESEERYRRLTDNAFDLIMEVDSESRLLYASPNHRAVLGYEPDELIGRVSLELVHPEEREEVTRAFRHLIASGWDREVVTQIRHKDGSWCWFECSGNAYQAPGGEMRAVIVSRDITERKRSEAELARHRHHLEELVATRTAELESSSRKLRHAERLASIGTFAAGIAHQINNPVGGILVAAQYAATARDDPAAVDEALEDIVAEATRCGKIVRHLLRFAQEDTSFKVPGEFNRLVRSCATHLSRRIEEAGVEIELSLDPDLPTVSLNETAMEEVLSNLLQNSVEAGAQHIALRTQAGQFSARLVVEDDGRGIGSENRHHVFDPFFTTRQGRGGTGLGLSIGHGIVADHGGTIEFESEPGHGTTVTIELPWAEEESVQNPGR